ncbi:MAG: aldehyde dehydrogenase (NADP(+)), partial [Spongiibacteraceae bacterium]|nr:aldehyde dehydrogenase (NADP(+)) [Spongiibacteraceae bacterium]
ALGGELTERVVAETGYPKMRAEGERGRTCGQLKLFASTIVSGEYLDIRIDTALPERQPAPRPDIRYMNQALGPVAVFGASNFPLAFSVAGGDTASAFAAGCPVIVKGHNSHPGTSELVAQAIDSALKKCGLPSGVFSLIMGSGNVVGAQLVVSPAIKAVGFTGSFTGGMALFKLANDRPEPIPVFAEMGSVNPVVLLPKALEENAASIAENFVVSLNMGTGQFCVNPGLVIALESDALAQFEKSANEALSSVAAGVMLNQNIQKSYQKGVSALSDNENVSQIALGATAEGTNGFCAQATLLKVSASGFLASEELQEEVFGPVSLLVSCKNKEELLSVVNTLKGQLTSTLQCTENELPECQDLVDILRRKVGRLVINGYPTGVEVSEGMMHGGPFPASTDARYTSVGTAAIARFVRPICFQNYPESQLPDALRDSNPLQINRTIDGVRSKKALD